MNPAPPVTSTRSPTRRRLRIHRRGAAAVGPDVFVADDAHTLKPLGSVAAGVGPSHIVARGTTAYVADTQGDQILVFAIGPKPRLLGKVPAPGTPYGLALDPGRDRLWVTETATDRIAPRGGKR